MNKTVAQYLAEQSTRNKAKASHWNELTSDKHFKNKLRGKSTNTVSERIAKKRMRMNPISIHPGKGMTHRLHPHSFNVISTKRL